MHFRRSTPTNLFESYAIRRNTSDDTQIDWLLNNFNKYGQHLLYTNWKTVPTKLATLIFNVIIRIGHFLTEFTHGKDCCKMTKAHPLIAQLSWQNYYLFAAQIVKILSEYKRSDINEIASKEILDHFQIYQQCHIAYGCNAPRKQQHKKKHQQVWKIKF